MDFISILPTDAAANGLVIAAYLVLTVGGIFGAVGFLLAGGRARTIAIGVTVSLIVCASGFAVALLDNHNHKAVDAAHAKSVAERADRFSAETDARYGIDLSDKQFDELAYPDEKPTKPEIFGKTEALAYDGADLTATTVRLAWTGQNFVLLTDGTPGEWSELPTL